MQSSVMTEGRTYVTGRNPVGCYSRDINYTGASLPQLASLTKVSCTVGSLSSSSVMFQCFSRAAHGLGGGHMTLLRWRAGVEHLSMVSAHAGWPAHVHSPVLVVTVMWMTKYRLRQRSPDWWDKASPSTTNVWRYLWMIFPILTYNSEIWGVYAKPEFKTWDSSQIEKTHLQFCKRF